MQADSPHSALDDLPSLPPALLEEFVHQGIPRNFRKNAIVVTAGEPAEALYLVLEGNLLVYLDDESGKVAELRRLNPGEYFGELMLGGQVRTASVKTLGPARLCVVRRVQFERILSKRPDLAFHVIQTLIERVRDLTDNVRGLALMDVYGRVAKLLNESAQAGKENRQVVILSQQSIAERVSASRSMVNRILQDLVAGGYIAASRGRIELLKPLPRRW
jgi:CRP/FNR family transcriptional regulator, cyclic AMP receptor protein